MPEIENSSSYLVWALFREIPESQRNIHMTASASTMAWFLEEGSVKIQYEDGEILEVQAGKWIFLKEKDGFQNFTKGSKLLSIRFDLLANGRSLYLRRNTLVTKKSKAGLLYERGRDLVNQLDQHRIGSRILVSRKSISLEDDFQIQGAFNFWLSEYIRVMDALRQPKQNYQIQDDRVRQAILLLENHSTEVKLNEAYLASQCGLSFNQLNLLFRNQTGQTMGDYYNARRERLARQKLSFGAEQIKEIAYELGFNSPAHFTAWFNSRTGKAPSVYRRKHKH